MGKTSKRVLFVKTSDRLVLPDESCSAHENGRLAGQTSAPFFMRQ
jgi:hypothetical protein